MYALGVTALSVAMAFLYWKTGRSLLLTMLMHAAVNNTKDIVPSAASSAVKGVYLGATRIAWLSVAVQSAVAAYLLVRMRNVRLQDDDPATSALGTSTPTAN